MPTVNADSNAPDSARPSSLTSAALQSVKSAVTAPENELRRWRRQFDANAKVEVDGQKYIFLAFYLIIVFNWLGS